MTALPEIGMGATIDNWSERIPVTVIEVKCFKSGARKGEPCEVTVQHDNWIVIGGGESGALYEYVRDSRGATFAYIRNVNNNWVLKGRGGRGSKLILGLRELALQPEWLVGPLV